MTSITARATELMDNYTLDLEVKLSNSKLTLENRLKIIKEPDADIFMSLTKAEEVNQEITDAGTYSESINELIIKIDDTIRKHRPQPQVGQSPNVNSVQGGTGALRGGNCKTSCKLPKLTWKPYSGNLTAFVPFWNSYSAAIDKNSALSDVDEMTHLKTLCVGEATLCISGFSISPANYNSALELLKSRFGDPRIIVNHHMDSLVNLQPVKSENDIKGLRFLDGKVMSHIRALEALKVETSTCSQLLVSMLTKTIPQVLMIEVSKSMKEKTWDLENPLQVLKDELEACERVGLAGCKSQNFEQRNTLHKLTYAKQGMASVLFLGVNKKQ